MTIFKPMLACEADLDTIKFPVIASPKLDGIRATVTPQGLLTRSLKEVPNRHVFELLSQQVLWGMDGELIVGDPTAKDVYRQTVSGVMTKAGTPEFTFRVFDFVSFDEDAGEPWEVHYSYTRRAELLELLVKEFKSSAVVMHDIMVCDDLLQLRAYEEACLEKGYEGLILRDPNSGYKFGRSTAKEGLLLKLKRFQDSEAEILEVIEEMHNTNEAKTNALGRTERSSAKAGKVGKGRMGALRVKDVKSGVEFELGTGFDDSDKAAFWKARSSCVGRLVKYKFFPIGVKDKPRHPVYLGMRDKKDMS